MDAIRLVGGALCIQAPPIDTPTHHTSQLFPRMGSYMYILDNRAIELYSLVPKPLPLKEWECPELTQIRYNYIVSGTAVFI